MDSVELIKNVTFNLSSVAHCRLGEEWNYQNVVSSFTRLYLITEGEAVVYIWDKKVRLRKGHLYLIPSFANCSYICSDFMEQYYATFTIHLPNHILLTLQFYYAFRFPGTF